MPLVAPASLTLFAPLPLLSAAALCRHGLNSEVFVALSVEKKVQIIGGK